MGTIEWDKPKDRRYEIGIDRGVLYPNNSEGVAWNGLVSVDEEASGADVEPLYIDGYKYFDSVANEDFQATLSAFTYPDEFEPCLGNVKLANGMYATRQRRETFGVSWRTKTGNAADGETGYKIHILYGATAVPSTKSNETLGDTPQPVNFQWTITAVPQLPGMDLTDPNSDPNSWVWPEGYGMPGWPVGPDGNTPVPGWRGFPYVIVDSNDLDPVALADLETRLYGGLHTPAYLPTLTDVTNLINGQDVPYDYNFDWTDPNPPDSGPKFYWSPSDWLIQSYDTSTGELKALTNADPRIPTPCQNYDMGGPIRLGNGKFFIRSGTSGGDQVGFIIDADLNPTGEYWVNPQNTDWTWAGYTAYDTDDGVYDPISDLNWLADTVVQHPWEWNGFDNQGRFVRGLGDTIKNASGDGFYGADGGRGVVAQLIGRWLYRNGPDGDIVTRNNIDTGAWEAVFEEYQDPSDTTQGLGSFFLGIDETVGMVTLNAQFSGRTNYDGKAGWIQVRDPSTMPWKNPIPNGFATPLSAMGRPLRQYDPAGPGGPQFPSVGNQNGRYVLVQNGKLYYASSEQDYGYEYSSNPNGIPYGNVAGIYMMDLSNGSISKICDIPFTPYKADGSVAVDATDNVVSGNDPSSGFRNLLFNDGSWPAVSNNLNFTPPLTVTEDYTANGWTVPQIAYGTDDSYTAITDLSDDSWARNTYSKLDTSLPSAGTQLELMVVASSGTKAQIDGMSFVFRVKADSDAGLVNVPLTFFISDTYRYVVSGGNIPCDGAWHDVTVTLTEQELIDATANQNIAQGLFDEMSASGMKLAIYIDSAWADAVGAAVPWNFWLDFANIEVHAG